jgi:hypothetical protein
MPMELDTRLYSIQRRPQSPSSKRKLKRFLQAKSIVATILLSGRTSIAQRGYHHHSSLLHILALSARTKSMNFEAMKKNCAQTIQTHHRNRRLILGSCVRPIVETANVWEYKLHRRMEGATKRGEVGEVTFLRISAPSWESCPRWKKWQNFSRKFTYRRAGFLGNHSPSPESDELAGRQPRAIHTPLLNANLRKQCQTWLRGFDNSIRFGLSRTSI